MTVLYATVANRDPFAAQAAGLLLPTMRGQLTVRAHYAPPGQTYAPREDVADSACRAGVAGAARHLPVADHLALAQVPDDDSDGVGERSGHSGARCTALFPCDQDGIGAKDQSDARSGRECRRLGRR